MARLSCRHCITVSLFICVSIFRAKLLFSPPPCVKKRIYHSLHWSASNKQKKGGKKQISSSPRVHVLINGAAPKTAPPAPLLTEGNLSCWINPSYQYVWVWQLWRQDSSSSRARGADSVWTLTAPPSTSGGSGSSHRSSTPYCRCSSWSDVWGGCTVPSFCEVFCLCGSATGCFLLHLSPLSSPYHGWNR